MARQEDKSKVAVLSSAEGALHRSRIGRQGLVGLLDGHIVRFYRLLGREGVENPSTMVLTNASSDMYIAPTIEVIKTSYLTVEK